MEINEELTDLKKYNTDINSLPDEILEFILTYLPPYRELDDCSLVCKRWNRIVKNLIRHIDMNFHNGLVEYNMCWKTLVAQIPTADDYAMGNVQNTSTISGRFSHSAVRHGNYMYIFGGGAATNTTYNDLCRFDLSNLRWERALSKGSYPSPKASASMVVWRETFVIFGGWRYPSHNPPYQPWCMFDELHYYDLATYRWTAHASLPRPPAMAGHSASVHGDRMVIFGGYRIVDGSNTNSNEVWCLNLLEHKWWKPHIVGDTKPAPRYGPNQLELDNNHLLLMGGCGGPNNIFSDAWILDMSRDDGWTWRSIPVRNKNYSPQHTWCNPSCRFGSKLIMLGPTPNMPNDFQMMRGFRVSMGENSVQLGAAGHVNQYERPRQLVIDGLAVGNVVPARNEAPQQLNQNRFENLDFDRRDNMRVLRIPAANRPDEQYYAHRRAVLNQHEHHQINQDVANNRNNNGVQPRSGKLGDLHTKNSTDSAVLNDDQNLPSTSKGSSIASDNANNINNKEQEAANRLQRNLGLRCRENEPVLPKRFDEVHEDPFRMAAFNVQSRSPRSLPRDHSERIRRMEEKMNAIRNSRRNAVAVAIVNPYDEPKPQKEPSPKRIKRNVFSVFVCDISAAQCPKDAHVKWYENKNGGILPGAPERLIFSTMVPGNGELVVFGGVHKETLNTKTHTVSNWLHFLRPFRDIV